MKLIPWQLKTKYIYFLSIRKGIVNSHLSLPNWQEIEIFCRYKKLYHILDIYLLSNESIITIKCIDFENYNFSIWLFVYMPVRQCVCDSISNIFKNARRNIETLPSNNGLNQCNSQLLLSIYDTILSPNFQTQPRSPNVHQIPFRG